MSSAVSITALLKKTEHYDKDERYMATSDLCEILKRQSSSASSGTTTQLDQATEQRICTAVLRLLHDKSNDVQAIAVKTLGVLIATVGEPQVLEIADSLTHAMLDYEKGALRDVYAIGLRTLVKTIPHHMGPAVGQRLVGRLLDGIRVPMGATSAGNGNGNDNSQEDVMLACLDVWMDLVSRPAFVHPRQHEPLLQSCLVLLGENQSAIVRKRAGSTLGVLSVVLSDVLLKRMVESLLSQIEMADDLGTTASRKESSSGGTAVGETRALIRTMCTVSGAVGHRLNQEQIDRIIPIFLKFCVPKDAVTGDDDDMMAAAATDTDEAMGDQNENTNQDEQMDADDDDYNDDYGEEEEDDAAIALANELRESCFMGFESFVSRCPKEIIEPHLDAMIQAALAYMSYDPNYSYGIGEDEDNRDEADESGDEYEDDEDLEDEEEEDDDDDDSSWKVRRAAIRSIMAVIVAKQEDPSRLWSQKVDVRLNYKTTVANALVSRFKEREEHCRVGVIDSFAHLLSVTVAAATVASSSKKATVQFATSIKDDTAMTTIDDFVTIDLRNTYGPAVVKACETLLTVKKGSGERSKSSALSLLSTLSQAPGGVGGEIEVRSVLQHVKTFLAQDTTSNRKFATTSTSQDNKTLQLDALRLIRTMLCSGQHDMAHIQSGLVEILLPDLCAAVQEQWYKVIAETLRVLTEIPPFFSPAKPATPDDSVLKSVAAQLYQAIQPLLAASDVDQEIKECALIASAALMSNMHMHLSQDQLEGILKLLLEKLRNETTRIAAIKTISSIASFGNTTTALSGEDGDVAMTDGSGGDKLNLTSIIGEAITAMGAYLKQQSRHLKQSSLEALNVVITYHGKLKDEEDAAKLYSTVLQDLAGLMVVETSDVHLCHLSLRVAKAVLVVCPSAGPAVKEHVLSSALALSTSSHLQEATLDSLLALWEQIIRAGTVIDFDEVLNMLKNKAGDGGSSSSKSKVAVPHLARCIAVITSATTEEKRATVVRDLLTPLDGASVFSTVSETTITLNLLILGDLGRNVDFGSLNGGMLDRLKLVYLRAFDAENIAEDVKQAAAYALGRSAVGSQAVLLPAIVSSLEQQSHDQKKKYLLLMALKEFIQCQTTPSASSIPIILPHLLTHTSDLNEGARTIVAECMGSLTSVAPAEMLPQLKELQKAHSGEIVSEAGHVKEEDVKSKMNALVCNTVATSVKHAVARQLHQHSNKSTVDGSELATELAKTMPSFLELIQIKEVGVRNAAFLMVYSAIHHMPETIAPFMKELVMPTLFDVIDLRLKRVVDLGPFKHTVDDALPLRKSAMSIFTTCLEKHENDGSVTMDILTFTTQVLPKALADVEDVQLQAHNIVMNMCQRHPSILVANLDCFVQPLEELFSEKMIKKKTNNKTGTELERAKEWIKSGLRALWALDKLDRNGASPKFTTLVDRVKMSTKLRPILEALEEER